MSCQQVVTAKAAATALFMWLWLGPLLGLVSPINFSSKFSSSCVEAQSTIPAFQQSKITMRSQHIPGKRFPAVQSQVTRVLHLSAFAETSCAGDEASPHGTNRKIYGEILPAYLLLDCVIHDSGIAEKGCNVACRALPGILSGDGQPSSPSNLGVDMNMED
jgi:hypothetical protein